MDENRIEPTVTEAVHRLVRALRRRPPSEPRGTRGYIRLLRLILAHDDSSPGELAELLDIRPSSLTEMLGHLELDGLIVRRRDEKDLRVVRVGLTEHGRARLDSVGPSALEYDILKDLLTPEETRDFVRLCDKLCDKLEKRAEENGYTSESGGHGHGHHHRGHHHPDENPHEAEES